MGPTSAAVGMGGQRSEGSAPRHGGGGEPGVGFGGSGSPTLRSALGRPYKGHIPKGLHWAP